MNPEDLFVSAIEWLRDTYADHNFFVERDIVWSLQKHLAELVRTNNLNYLVFNDFPVKRGKRRGICADIAILSHDRKLLFIAELKYEPAHSRSNIWPTKFPVVGWKDIVKDTVRVRRFVEEERVPVGWSVFIDEGSHFYLKERPDHAQWQEWPVQVRNGVNIHVLLAKFELPQ